MNYADPRLTAVHDSLNPAGKGDRFYLNLAGSLPLTVLDVGCGTWWLAQARCVSSTRGRSKRHLETAGFKRLAWYGDWDGSAVGLDSRSLFSFVSFDVPASVRATRE
jgi:hypothetical protein